MEAPPVNKRIISLYELNSEIKSAINHAFPVAYWITAEISDFKCNQKGHCYLELIEKKDEVIIAQAKAVIWAYEYRKLGHKFQSVTGESLKTGIKILLLAAVTCHEVYGLSLNVRDIDPAYTIGEMALKKKEVIERLKKEGIMNLNKELPLPLVPMNIAVISSPTAAGYGDFLSQIDGNPYGYKFIHILFPALMQGGEAEESIISAMTKIKKQKRLFDVVVIIRGGGSAIDLNCFDGYALAACVARFPLPVITGIGHERDDTVVDMAAHTRMKTPTAVAEFLISGVRGFEERILDIQNRIVIYIERLLKDEQYRLNTLARRLSLVPIHAAALRNKLIIMQRDIKSRVRQTIQKEDGRLNSLEQAVRLLDPANIMQRGYSITRLNGKALKDASKAKKGDAIETLLYKGTITSIVGRKREVKDSEQEQTAYVLPGFE